MALLTAWPASLPALPTASRTALAPSPTPFATSLATPFEPPLRWLDFALLLMLLVRLFARDFVFLALLEALDFFAGFALFVFV
ncbi:MAG TPA: hypothetical protein VH042_04775 [Solirubrobacterales bacterium]|nr:hypothetical protein [Solirubrobacterales bacterium]